MLNSKNRWQTAVLFVFHLLFLVLPLSFTWINEELFEFNKMIVVYFATVLIGGTWLMHMAWTKKVIWRRTIFDLPIGFFLVSQLLSSIFSIDLHTSLFGYYTRFHGGLLSSISYAILFAAFVTYVEKKHLAMMFRTLALSATAVVLMAIPEHFGHAFSCMLILTDRQMSTSGLAALAPANLLNNYGVSCWIQDVQNRVYATFGQPNWLAAYAVTLLPLTMTLGLLAQLEKKQKQTVGWSLLSIGLFLTVLFTKSRSGFLGLAVSFALFVAGVLWTNKPTKVERPQIFKAIGLIVVVCVLCVGIFGSPYIPSLVPQAAPATPAANAQPAVNRLDVGGTDSGQIRRIVWSGAFDIWRHYPIFGSGVETFAYSYFQFRPMAHNVVSEWDFLYNKAHNEFLNFLATTGLVGLIAYCMMLSAFIGVPLWVSQKATQLSSKLLGLSVACGLIALSITNFFGFSTVTVAVLLFCLPAMLLVAIQQFRWPELKQNSRAATDLPALVSASPRTPTTYILTVTAALLTLTLLWRTTAYWLADASFAKGKAFAAEGQLQPALAAYDIATKLNPDEAYILDEVGSLYGSAAQSLAASGDATAGAQVGELAIETAKTTIALNPVHPTYYKSLARVYLNLATFQTEYLASAEGALVAAEKLAPTDPKLPYNLGLIRAGLNKMDESLADFELTVQMKPNYEDARMTLASEYEKRNRYADARQQYQYILDNIQPDNQTAQQKLKELPTSNQSATPAASPKPAKKR